MLFRSEFETTETVHVTRDMAIDAGDLALEGAPMSESRRCECPGLDVPDLAGALERLRTAGESIELRAVAGYITVRLGARFGPQNVYAEFPTLADATAWLDALAGEGKG